MGFNNAGVAARLRARGRGRGVVAGVSIGKSKAVPEIEAVAGYAASARVLADVAQYLVVNVSSPNTPGLRNLQAVEHLRPLLVGVRDALDEASSRGPRRRMIDQGRQYASNPQNRAKLRDLLSRRRRP